MPIDPFATSVMSSVVPAMDPVNSASAAVVTLVEMRGREVGQNSTKSDSVTSGTRLTCPRATGVPLGKICESTATSAVSI